MALAVTGKHAREPFDYGPSFAGEIRQNEPMRHHTTYRIGGPARYFASVENLSALKQVLRDSHTLDIPWTIVGQGSNLLVSDDGFDGVVIVLQGDFKRWSFNDDGLRFTVGGGVPLARIVMEAFHQGVSGLEFAVGTPGTVGGALRMNAGSRSEWIGSRVASLTTYSLSRGLDRRKGDEIVWEYRHSSIPLDEIVVECELAVERGSEMFIRGKMDGALARRKKSQPLGLASCGSVFKNPEGQSAGALIEEVGLKGCSIGGAQVSEVHANFIVNTGGATAADILSLMRLIQDKVEEAYGIELQPEVRFLGFA